MKSSPFQDRRASGLLDRVRNDVSHLREDLGSLLTHTTRQTLPNGAREIADHARSGARDFADQARNSLAAGGAYAADRFRNLRAHPPRREASWVGGAILAGVVAYGLYALYRSSCELQREAEEINE